MMALSGVGEIRGVNVLTPDRLFYPFCGWRLRLLDCARIFL
jgi:hypothetical protein